MDFEMTHEGEQGAPVPDVVQEAFDATATTYTRSPHIDVEHTLREELRSRGLRATSDADVEEMATAIRSGHALRLGKHDGSIE